MWPAFRARNPNRQRGVAPLPFLISLSALVVAVLAGQHQGGHAVGFLFVEVSFRTDERQNAPLVAVPTSTHQGGPVCIMSDLLGVGFCIDQRQSALVMTFLAGEDQGHVALGRRLLDVGLCIDAFSKLDGQNKAQSPCFKFTTLWARPYRLY